MAWLIYLIDGLEVDPGSTFKYWYMWTINYVICVALNSAANPLLLFFRNRQFRNYVGRKTIELKDDLVNRQSLKADGSTVTNGFPRSPNLMFRDKSRKLILTQKLVGKS